jgi:NAD(P)-dependent dehydrogenase (short-subunit alcohol dehydrogenase family)
VAKHGIVVLVGRNREKLNKLHQEIERKGGHAVSVVCDLSDIASVRRAAAEIGGLPFPIAGPVSNAGIMQMRPTRNALGWDMSFATNHLGQFALTEALVRSLPNGANVVFIVSAVEDPERKPAVAAGFEVVAISPQRRVRRRNGNQAAPQSRVSMPTLLPNKRSLLR